MLRCKPLVALAALVALMGSAHAGEWPDKPVRIIYPYAAGSNGDATARVIAQRLSAAFGQPFIVEIGWEQTVFSELRRSRDPLPTVIRSCGRSHRKF